MHYQQVQALETTVVAHSQCMNTTGYLRHIYSLRRQRLRFPQHEVVDVVVLWIVSLRYLVVYLLHHSEAPAVLDMSRHCRGDGSVRIKFLCR